MIFILFKQHFGLISFLILAIDSIRVNTMELGVSPCFFIPVSGLKKMIVKPFVFLEGIPVNIGSALQTIYSFENLQKDKTKEGGRIFADSPIFYDMMNTHLPGNSPAGHLVL